MPLTISHRTLSVESMGGSGYCADSCEFEVRHRGMPKAWMGPARGTRVRKMPFFSWNARWLSTSAAFIFSSSQKTSVSVRLLGITHSVFDACFWMRSQCHESSARYSPISRVGRVSITRESYSPVPCPTLGWYRSWSNGRLRRPRWARISVGGLTDNRMQSATYYRPRQALGCGGKTAHPRQDGTS